jgi:tetratricopeptide (TPR) repeat protein
LNILKSRYFVTILAGILVHQNALSAEQQSAKEKPQPAIVKSVSATKADALQKLLSEAQSLLNSAKPAEAFKLLLPMDFEYSGDVRFDYLLGVSALDSGHPDKATLAFERVLAVDPNFAGARLDMARAYFHLGDMARARTEFDAVLKQDPPQAARLTIEKYLTAIESAKKAKNNRYSGYVEGAIGRDSNVNNSTSQSEVAVPALGNLVFTLSPTNLKTPDNYYSVAAGGEINQGLSDSLGVYGGADLRKRGNRSLTSFNSGSVDIRAGIFSNIGDEMFRLGATLGKYTLAETAYRNAIGLTGDWRHNLNKNNQLNVFGQYSRNRFAQSEMQQNDFNQTVIGTGFLHVLSDGKTALFSSINLGKEAALHDRADGDKTGYGLRVGGQTSIHESIDTYANVGYQIGRYNKENISFLATRIDKQFDVTIGGNWHWNKLWTMRPQISYSKNNSTIQIYGFDRLDASITVRRDF